MQSLHLSKQNILFFVFWRVPKCVLLDVSSGLEGNANENSGEANDSRRCHGWSDAAGNLFYLTSEVSDIGSPLVLGGGWELSCGVERSWSKSR